MLSDQTWVAIAAIVVGGLVTVAQSLGLHIAQSRTEEGKWKRERNASIKDTIDKATCELLDILSVMLSKEQEPRAQNRALDKQESEKLVASLRTKFYTWETVIWPYLSKTDEELIKTMQAALENTNVPTLYYNADTYLKELPDNILRSVRGVKIDH